MRHRAPPRVRRRAARHICLRHYHVITVDAKWRCTKKPTSSTVAVVTTENIYADTYVVNRSFAVTSRDTLRYAMRHTVGYMVVEMPLVAQRYVLPGADISSDVTGAKLNVTRRQERCSGGSSSDAAAQECVSPPVKNIP